MASEQARPGHDGPGGVREAHHPFDVPAGQQPVAQRAAERVTGAEPVEHVDRHRRHLDRHGPVVREHALRTLLDDRETDAELVQRAGGGQRLPLPHRGIALVEVADRDGHMRQRLLDPVPGLLPRVPEHRPVIQVQDGDLPSPSRLQRGEGRGTARLGAKTGPGDPEDTRRADGVQVQFLAVDLQVRCFRPAVEVEREVVRREDLAERHRRRELRHRGDIAVVDAIRPQRRVHEPPERVVAGPGDDRGAPLIPGGGYGDVGRAAAEVLSEGLDVLEMDAGLQRIQVDADPSHGEDLEGAHRAASLDVPAENTASC